MKYQPLHDLIDPDLPPEGSATGVPREPDPDAPNDAYVIGEHGRTMQAPEGGEAAASDEAPRRWVRPAAIALSLLCAALTVWNLARLIEGPPPPPKPSAFQVRQALYLGVMKIEAYRRAHGVTPSGLADAGLPDPGSYAYRRIDSRHYVLSFQLDGPAERYDSAIPMEQAFGSPEQMLTMGGSR